MKKILLFSLALMLCTMSFAQKKRVYVNPVTNSVKASTSIKKRIATKVIYGLSQAKTLEAVMGDEQIDKSTLVENGYNYVVNLNVVECKVEQDTELLSSKKKDTYTASVNTKFVMVDLATGDNVIDGNISDTGNDKDSIVAYYKAIDYYNTDALDFVDIAFPIYAQIQDVILKDNKKSKKDDAEQEAQSVIINAGSLAGVRKDMMFDLYKADDATMSAIGKARCEQVLGPDQALLKVYSTKDGDKAIFNILNEIDDESKMPKVISRPKKSWGRVGTELKNVFTANKERGNYYEVDFERAAKLKVGIKSCDADFSNVTEEQVAEVAKTALAAFDEVTTIIFDSEKLYPTLEAAKAAGLDGVLDVTIDNVIFSTETKKDSKTQKDVTTYCVNLHVTLAAINVHTGAWIEMISKQTPASSKESKTKAFSEAVSFVKDDIRKFAEDVFPVGGIVITSEKGDDKKKIVKEASIAIGKSVGVSKGMMFDIYVQKKQGDADSREYLGTGKVKGEPTETSAIISIKGKNDGESKLYELLNGESSGEQEPVVISRAAIDRINQALDNVGGVMNGIGSALGKFKF